MKYFRLWKTLIWEKKEALFLERNKINALSIMIESGFNPHVEVAGEDDVDFVDIYDYKKFEKK